MLFLLKTCSPYKCRYHPYDAVTIRDAERKTSIGNTEDSKDVFHLWRDVVVVEENNGARWGIVGLGCGYDLIMITQVTECQQLWQERRNTTKEKGRH